MWVENSEIFACDVDTGCATIHLQLAESDPPSSAIHIISSLLWGGKVSATKESHIQCLWVADEKNTGFGWPTMGTIVENYLCP